VTTVFTPSANLYIPGTVNKRVITASTTGSNLGGTFTPEAGGSGLLLLGVDWTATQGTGSYNVYAQVASGPIFYWDSQSIGEGNGVTYAWRGQLIVNPGEQLSCQIVGGSSTAVLGIIAWGLQGQLRTTVNLT
jgi:hypothetical protein